MCYQSRAQQRYNVLEKPEERPVKLIERLEKQMKEAAKLLEFEIAAELRDQIILLKGHK